MFFKFNRSDAAKRTAISQVQPEWLVERMAAQPGDGPLRIIDVREASEFDGPLGHIEGAELVPLASLQHVAATWDREQTLVLVCRSGARSARACQLLSQHGFEKIHNLRGGMIGWGRRRR